MDSDPYSSSSIRKEEDEQEFEDIKRQQSHDRENKRTYHESSKRENQHESFKHSEFNREFYKDFESIFKSQRQTNKDLDIHVSLSFDLVRNGVVFEGSFFGLGKGS